MLGLVKTILTKEFALNERASMQKNDTTEIKIAVSLIPAGALSEAAGSLSHSFWPEPLICSPSQEAKLVIILFLFISSLFFAGEDFGFSYFIGHHLKHDMITPYCLKCPSFS